MPQHHLGSIGDPCNDFILILLIIIRSGHEGNRTLDGIRHFSKLNLVKLPSKKILQCIQNVT